MQWYSWPRPSNSGDDASVRDFSEIQSSDFEFTVDENGATASFTLPDAPVGGDTAMDEHGTKVAEGASVIDVSAVFSGFWVGENAFDGEMTTEWATGGSGDDAFIVIDLGSPRSITGLEFITRTMSDGSATTTQYTVTVDDGDTYGPFIAGDQSDSASTAVGFTGQQLRFDVAVSTVGNTGAIEIRAFSSTSG